MAELDAAIALFQEGKASFAWLCAQAGVRYYYAQNCLLDWEEKTGREAESASAEEIRGILKSSMGWRWRKRLGERLRAGNG